ncbi:ABC transporter substrate-binding protein [Actinomyces howellii]|uniref:Maltose-binding periplasmic proteins/domains n=1 Tax=Actinomyces howellii TaxID=52771 RepID=A0A448HHD2_9ACTO|nr:ABC transporter substrate-binding protein [Actinomyces howellii]VEG28486.1 Maltose-binding periplasmic proteins/domains [Actinomyces howellii]
MSRSPWAPLGPRSTVARSGSRALPRSAARSASVLAVLALAASATTACSPGGGGTEATDGAGCEQLEAYGTVAQGQTVTVGTVFSGNEAARFEASLARFEECTGIDVVHSGSDQLESVLRDAAASGSPSADPSLPDLAVVPQSGLVTELIDAGAVSALPDTVGANIELGWDRAWSDVGAVDGTLYAAPLMASVKSFVWYSPAAFEASGYQVPRTWEELVELTDQVVADHPDGAVTPWCMGVADGEATGWPATDWLEDALLATQGTGAFDSWADHEAPLDSDSAVEALDAVGDLVLADGHVPGGRAAAATTTVEEAGQQLVSGTCLMLHASSSYETVLPTGTLVTDANGEHGVKVSPTTTASAAPTTGQGGPAAEQGSPAATGTASAQASPTVAVPGAVSAFLLPSRGDDDGGTPVLVGGDYLVALRTSEAAVAVMGYLTSAEWAQERVELGGMASANRGVDASDIESDVARRATELLQSRQTVIRLDGSDTMPSAVGTDALWTALTQWTAGELSSEEALAQAEEAWPSD